MQTIYIDKDFKCHISNDGTMTAIATEYFDGKCNDYIKGYCCEPNSKGGFVFYPWKPYDELDAVQIEYERQLLAEYSEALRIMGVSV